MYMGRKKEKVVKKERVKFKIVKRLVFYQTRVGGAGRGAAAPV